MCRVLTHTIARNLMRDMKKGDYAFFYHSNCKTPAVVGVMEIVQEHSPDGSDPILTGLMKRDLSC